MKAFKYKLIRKNRKVGLMITDNTYYNGFSIEICLFFIAFGIEGKSLRSGYLNVHGERKKERVGNYGNIKLK